jgi:hypothetical protein
LFRESLAEHIKEEAHGFIDKHCGGDAGPVKGFFDTVFDHPTDLPEHAPELIGNTLAPSTTVGADKDDTLDKAGNPRTDNLVGRSAVPDMPKDVGVTEVHPGPMIGPAPESAKDDDLFEGNDAKAQVNQAQRDLGAPAPAPAPVQHDHQGAFGGGAGGGHSGGYAGPDAHSSQVDRAGSTV